MGYRSENLYEKAKYDLNSLSHNDLKLFGVREKTSKNKIIKSQ